MYTANEADVLLGKSANLLGVWLVFTSETEDKNCCGSCVHILMGRKIFKESEWKKIIF